MSIFDLLFIGAVVITGIFVIAVLILVVRGRWRTAARTIVGWAIFAAVYLAASVSVSYFQPQRVLAIGDPWCFDDWCLKVNNVDVMPSASRNTYDVQMRIFSRAGRVSQRAKGAWLYLVDDQGHLYRPQVAKGEVPMDVMLRPSESVATSRTFQVPAEAHSLGLITGHGGPYCGAMSVLVIGDGGCWFHKPPMIRIQ